jgi:hypothetical protein
VDELWQRYRTFWVPVLYGVGAFLAGLIVVHIVTSDPEVGVSQNESKVRVIKGFTAPSETQIKGAKKNIEALKAQLDAKARVLDQRHGDGDDPIDAFTKQALRAALLRGSEPADPERFDGDATAASQASARYTQMLADSVSRLRNQDPNVAFSRLRADVVGELSIRANRADVDVGAGGEEFGLSSSVIASVDRAELPRRLANLALIATVLDVAIREGVRSIDTVVIENPETHAVQTGDQFVAEWPVKVTVTGTPDALSAILNLLTDPAKPTALGSCSWKQADRTKKNGLVRAEMKLYSVQVRPDVKINLEE